MAVSVVEPLMQIDVPLAFGDAGKFDTVIVPLALAVPQPPVNGML